MSDAGDISDRADSGLKMPLPGDSASNGAASGLSKRAARRRRKRKTAKPVAAVETQARPSAPKSAEPAPKPSEGASPRKVKRRGKPHRAANRPANRDAAGAGMRGVRQQGQTGGKGGGKAGQGASGGKATLGKQGGVSSARPSVRQASPQIDERRGPAVDAAAVDPATLYRPQPRAISGPLYAALDLGTNNCRLLIAEPQDRGFRVVDAFSRIVRLGEGIGSSGVLAEGAMDRAIEALGICRNKMRELQVRRMRLIATEACRAAANGAHFLERVQAETGLRLEIVDRETEARLAVAGCATLVDPRADGVVLFDIGGGSSELVWLDLRQRGEARGFALTRFIRSWTSLPVGVVTLSERHGGQTVTPQIFEDMVDEVSGMIAAFNGMDEVDDLVAGGQFHMLGTSGTVTTLAGLHLGLRRYDRRRVDGVWLDAVDVDRTTQALVDMGYDERVANPCIGQDRADLVLAGCAILEAIRRRWPCPRLRVADRGLREGILVELMARDGVWRRRPPVREQ